LKRQTAQQVTRSLRRRWPAVSQRHGQSERLRGSVSENAAAEPPKYCKILIHPKSRGNASCLSTNSSDRTTPEFVSVPMCLTGGTPAASRARWKLMTKSENRCAYCGGRFGLVSHQHRRLRFCRKACRDSFLAKRARDYAHVRKLLSCLSRGTSRSVLA